MLRATGLRAARIGIHDPTALLLRRTSGMIDPVKRSLRRRVYASLAVIGAGRAALTGFAYATHKGWANTWIPNFIAEWSGIFLAVVFVERLLARAEKEDADARLSPVRAAAAHRLLQEIMPAMAFVAATAPADAVDSHKTPRLTWSVVNKWVGELSNEQAALARVLQIVSGLNAALAAWENSYRDVLPAHTRTLVESMVEPAHQAATELGSGEADSSERLHRIFAFVVAVLLNAKMVSKELLAAEDTGLFEAVWEMLWAVRVAPKT